MNAENQDQNQCLRDISKRLDELQEDLTELKDAWNKHVTDYGELLRQTKVTAEERIKLRAAIVEKTLGGAVWAVIVFLAIAAWSYMKDHVK